MGELSKVNHGDLITTPDGVNWQVAQIQSHPPSMMEIIASASLDPRVDPDKLERLLAIHQKIRAEEARAAYNESMSACQAELPAVVRDAQNESNRSRYARLETVIHKIKPVVARHKFSLTFSTAPAQITGNVCVVCQVRHGSGHIEQFQLECPPDTSGPAGKPNKTAVQGLGATVSYLRRYLTLMAFNVAIANEDIDGQERHAPEDLEPAPTFEEDVQRHPPKEPKRNASNAGTADFAMLEHFAEIKKRYKKLDAEQRYYDVLAKFGKQKSNQFAAGEIKEARACYKVMSLDVQEMECAAAQAAHH